MPDFYELCVALLAAIGVVCLVWTLAGFILRPRDAFPMTVLIRARGADELAGAVQRYDWARRWMGPGFKLLIISDDLEPDASRFAALYAGDGSRASLCRMDDLEDTLDMYKA